VGLRILILGRLPDDVRREVEALGGSAEIHELAEGADPAAAIRALAPDVAVVGRPGSHPAFLEPAGLEALKRHVNLEYSRSVRYRHPFGLAMLSVDGLAELRETHGGPAADALADSVADAVGRAVREVDMMIRPSRSEIAVILPETEPTGARVVAERLRSVVARLLFKPAEAALQRPALPFKATASVGLAGCPQKGVGSGEDLVALARKSMEAARAEGGDRVATAF
jgi:diguanylate cyclase (GGDEF)-like protein